MIMQQMTARKNKYIGNTYLPAGRNAAATLNLPKPSPLVKGEFFY
jgi:hypothetical protein